MPLTTVPLPGTAIFIGVALIFAWLSDGPFRGRRYPFIYFGAIVTIAFAAVLRQRPLYKNVDQQIHLYWLCVIGVRRMLFPCRYHSLKQNRKVPAR
jgi:ACS family pantothenate transporter-like MFS transporter